jgi:dihydrofolate reductase
MLVSICAAMDLGRGIGVGGRLPWRLPAEMRRFRALTLGKTVVMGRRTFAETGQPLAGRENIVVSATPGFVAPGCVVARSLDEALALAHRDEAVVIGGERMFAEAMPRTGRIYLSVVEGRFEADVRFPRIDGRWSLVEQGRAERDAANAYPFRYYVLDRSEHGQDAEALIAV